MHNVVLPEDARGWAQIVFGDLPPLAADDEQVVRSAGSGYFFFFQRRLRPRPAAITICPAIVSAVKAATGRTRRGVVQALAPGAHRTHAWAGACAAAEGDAAGQGARTAGAIRRMSAHRRRRASLSTMATNTDRNE